MLYYISVAITGKMLNKNKQNKETKLKTSLTCVCTSSTEFIQKMGQKSQMGL